MISVHSVANPSLTLDRIPFKDLPPQTNLGDIMGAYKGRKNVQIRKKRAARYAKQAAAKLAAAK